MGLLSRDQIFAANDREFEEVDVPEWGGAVRLRGLTAAERDKYEGSLIRGTGRNRTTDITDGRAKLIILCAVDEAGARLFSQEDLRALSRKSAKPMDRLYDVAARLSGITDEAVDEAAADFVPAQSDDSDSG